ncbi:hypothetical protein CEN45_18375 [Fischerella thermalis CCMEE 5198]|uniref:hypothetical protein n=1 Tax=Fischerella thermalis TaxID=372787 RepID=UPI000C804E99|nr:hypothetical protein [Fischerella thermalis]PLZ87585.1 hypothetical protein CI594_21180 [Fischerella thermalis CCMEE 5196]PMB19747.1 hypothetical protein CEN45_18375 [Fischerella thermalis CCMEE 5198]
MTLSMQTKLLAYARILANEQQSFPSKKLLFYLLTLTFYFLLSTLPACAATVMAIADFIFK